MAEEITLADITDVTVLKALAYDRLAALEQIQNEQMVPIQQELQAINARIAEILNAPPPERVESGRVTTPRAPRKRPAKKAGSK